MKLVTRAQWGARPPKRVTRRHMNRASTGHWNGPRVPDVSHDRCASLVRGVQNFHMDGRGWNDIAYNFVICQHGYVFEGRGINVTNGANGTNEGNFTSHAVMWLDGQGNNFTDEEKRAFVECIHHIAQKAPAPPQAIGHRDHKSTECPGNERYNWIKSGMRVSGAPSVSDPKLPLLKRGDRGDYVKVAQTILKTKASAKLTVNSYFDVHTEAAVRNLQRFFKLDVDGIIGDDTWAVLRLINSR